jgi:DNA-binding NarL/FixJ family response regulator
MMISFKDLGRTLRTLLIDDHPTFLEGMTHVLSSLDDSIEFLEHTSCEDALKIEQPGDIDLILLDVHMPDGLDGLDGLRAIKERFPSAIVVMLSSENNPELILDLLDNGAAGFIHKGLKRDELIEELRKPLIGKTAMPDHALDYLLAFAKSRRESPPTENTEIDAAAVERLSKRQRQVLMKVVQGKGNKIVAHEMNISEGTVKAHLSEVFRALGVHNRTEAVFVAAKLGLTSRETGEE